MKHIQEHKHKRTLCAFFSPMVCHFFFFARIYRRRPLRRSQPRSAQNFSVSPHRLSFLSFLFVCHIRMISPLFTKWMRESVCVVSVFTFPVINSFGVEFYGDRKKISDSKRMFFAGIDTHRVWCSIYTISIRVCLNGIAISFFCSE